ncbi:hypothetical protein H5T88_01245 [bacterium]|nr:hypothetical protein [bacterium]
MLKMILLLILCLSVLAFAADAGQERITAFHETILSSFDYFALPGFFTYDHDPRYWLHNIALGKWRIGVKTKDKIVFLYEGFGQETTQTPEELVIKAKIGNHQVTARLFPMMVGREEMRWEGAVGLVVESKPPADIVVFFGAPGRLRILPLFSELPFRWQYLLQPELTLAKPKWMEKKKIFYSPIEETTLYVSASSRSLAEVSEDGFWLKYEAKGRFSMCVAFSEDESRAIELAKRDVLSEERKLKEHYKKLFESAWIKTPEPILDEAFRCALWNLEFNWVRPWGWIEAVHHWGTLYSQQHSLAADWLGQKDRSREMILTHARHILPDGMIPQLDTYGRARVDFGGWNQFYVWDVQHHWRLTGDRAFAKEIYSTLLKVIEKTFTAHDPDGNGLLGFGQQIGNQEDYISTPEDGTSPTIAGIEMLRTKEELAEALGDEAEAREAREKAKWMEDNLKKELWQRELGWFAFYKDALGVSHIEPPYHSLIWPVIYEILDPLDSYTSLRHLREALKGKDGEIYVSNLFPSYVNATVGSQAGGQQQPWATLGFCRLGFFEDGLAPLLWIAKLVVSPPHDGAWPELGIEPTRAYFSPPAAVFIWGVIEGLFGLQVDKPKGVLWLRPGIPLKWRNAELNLPDFKMLISHREGELTLRINTKERFKQCIRWALPIVDIKEVKVNGKNVPFKIQPLVSRILLTYDIPSTDESEIRIRYEPLSWRLSYPSRVAEGESFCVEIKGGEILAMEDRAGIVESWEVLGNGKIKVKLKERICELERRFGEVGRRLFSHRTFFLKCRSHSIVFWLPVDLEIVPPIEVEAKEDRLLNRSYCVSLFLRNNTSQEIRGKGKVEIGVDEMGKQGIVREVNFVFKKEQIILIPLLPHPSLLPGENRVLVHLPNGRILSSSVRLSELFEEHPYSQEKMGAITLPDEILRADEEWRSFRWWSAYGHPPWNSLRAPLEGIKGKEISVPALPGLRFPIKEGKLAVASWWINQPRLSIDVRKEARKLYFLLIPFLDHQDAYSKVGSISAICEDESVIRKELFFPGDLDLWGPPAIIGDFSTLGKGWSKSISVELPSAIGNVVELDLGKERTVEKVIIETNGRYPALGVLSLLCLR